MTRHLADIRSWQAEAERCERLQLGIYNVQVTAELRAVAQEYRSKVSSQRAKLRLTA